MQNPVAPECLMPCSPNRQRKFKTPDHARQIGYSQSSLYEYVVRCRSRADDPLLDTTAEVEALGDIARMLISRERGDLLTVLTRLLNVRSAVEVGTFTHYSSICIARGLHRADG